MPAGLKALLAGFGIDIPAGGVVLRPSTVVAAFVVGIGATAATPVTPAVKASRVPPIAAWRDVAFERTHPSPARIVVGVFAAATGVLAVISGVATKGSEGLSRIGLGAFISSSCSGPRWRVPWPD